MQMLGDTSVFNVMLTSNFAVAVSAMALAARTPSKTPTAYERKIAMNSNQYVIVRVRCLFAELAFEQVAVAQVPA